MNTKSLLFPILVSMLLISPAIVAEPAAADAKPDKVEQQRQAIRTMARETIEHLYAKQPRSRDALEQAAGYAVFNNFGLKIFVGGGGSGAGVAFERESRKATYMKMAELQAGFGLRFKKYRQVWVFERLGDLDSFVNSGWDFSGQSTLSAKVNGVGGSAFAGAISVRPGVWLYLISDDGLAVDVTLKGTKYYRNKALN